MQYYKLLGFQIAYRPQVLVEYKSLLKEADFMHVLVLPASLTKMNELSIGQHFTYFKFFYFVYFSLWLKSLTQCHYFNLSLAIIISSPEPKAHWRAYWIPMVRRPATISNVFSETAWPNKAQFSVELPCVGERKFVHGIWVT